jgi:hypothetical protein
MPSEIDFDAARVYAIPMRARFRGVTVREGMVIASLLDGDVVPGAESLRPADGHLPTHRTTRTGPTLLDTYELTKPEQAKWWRDRLARVCSVAG